MRKQLEKIIQNSSDPKLIERAFQFAENAHFGQKRFSGEEYILHPLRVAQILSEMHLDAKTVAAGFLHDVPDDTTKNLRDIEKEFGKEIAFLAEGVSKLGKLRYPKQDLEIKSPELMAENPVDSRAENLRKMFFAMAEDLRVVLIKLADRLHNMETLGSLPPDKRKRIALETLEIFAPLSNRLGIGGIKGQLEDLAFPYLYPKEYEWLTENVKEKYEKREKYLKRTRPFLLDILKDSGIKPLDIHSRPKHYWSLYQKLLKHEMDFERIHDLIALRVILDDVKTCYEALGIIHKHWRPLPGRIKDYIAFPKPNGYQAIHTTVFSLDGKIIEIQLKTKKMHEDAEQGICAHWAVKEGINLKVQRKKFAWVQQLSDWQKKIQKPEEFLEGLKVDFLKNRIFIFTPKGDVIDLPEGATAVDFAYAVHTDIGNHCVGAKTNGKIISLSQALRNGDVVEIIVDKNKKPSRDWLAFIKTGLARSRIKSELKKENRLGSLKSFFKEKTKNIRLFPKLRHKPSLAKGTKTETVVALSGEDGLQVYLAKCCSPHPGNGISAYITKNKGASVHKNDCPNLIRAQKKWPQKILEATWKKKG